MTSPLTPRRLLALFAALSLAPAGARAQITTPAEFAYIMDHETGATLFEKNADTPTAPASMSKLMTVAIVFEKLKAGELTPESEFFVSEKAWREREGSSMWVRVNTNISVINLLRGVIVQSGNDACIVIAENIAGTEEAFADLMTKKAREWGMNNSTFTNASGLPHPDHQMSMRDLAILSRKIIKDYPEYYPLFAEREFTWEGIKQPNRNPMFDMVEGADGLKTGHTEQSGYGLVGSAEQDGVRRIVVVNGLTSERERAQESARLMRVAFNDFVTKSVYEPGDIVSDAEVFKGVSSTVPLIVREPISMILHRSEADALKATVVYQGPAPAPIAEGQQIGYLRVESAGDMREYPLFAGRAVKELGVLGKIALAAKTLLTAPPKADAAPAAEAEPATP